MLQKHLTRTAGHPWDGRPGFDLMEFQCETNQECRRFVDAAQAKHWHPWMIGHSLDQPADAYSPTFPFGGVLYKPSGAMAPWSDHPDAPHPGATTASTTQ